MSKVKLRENDHVSGLRSASVTLVEYGDYECSYCGKAYPIVKRLQKKFGNQLAFVFRNFPLAYLHPNATHAAIAAEAAGLEDKFWPMHDILFENQRALEDSSLLRYAETIGLDGERFEATFGNSITVNKVNEDIESGNQLGVEGTPTFFINGKHFDGNWMENGLEEYIESLL